MNVRFVDGFKDHAREMAGLDGIATRRLNSTDSICRGLVGVKVVQQFVVCFRSLRMCTT